MRRCRCWWRKCVCISYTDFDQASYRTVSERVRFHTLTSSTPASPPLENHNAFDVSRPTITSMPQIASLSRYPQHISLRKEILLHLCNRTQHTRKMNRRSAHVSMTTVNAVGSCRAKPVAPSPCWLRHIKIDPVPYPNAPIKNNHQPAGTLRQSPSNTAVGHLAARTRKFTKKHTYRLH